MVAKISCNGSYQINYDDCDQQSILTDDEEWVLEQSSLRGSRIFVLPNLASNESELLKTMFQEIGPKSILSYHASGFNQWASVNEYLSGEHHF